IAFLREFSKDNYKPHIIALTLDYIFNFFLGEKNEIDRSEIIKKVEDDIKIKLPSAIPITNRQSIGTLVRALRSYYKFEILPPSYFIQRPNLPSDPKN